MIILQNNVKNRKHHYMNRYLLYISLMASSLLAATGCSDEVHEIILDIPTEEKTPIELSVGSMGAESATRAITVAPDDNSKLGTLPEGTALFMVMMSEKKNGSSSDKKYAVTKGVTRTADNTTKISPIDFSADGCTRYWDDCYARDAQLSVYAACCPGSTNTITIGGKSSYPYTSTPTTGAWSPDAIGLTIKDWSVSTEQTAQTIQNEDLCYSNNIADNRTAYTDGRMKFTPPGGTSGKFDEGNLCFYHALSWITFEIKMGDGFTTEEFKFAEGTNIKLTDFYTKNTEFDIAKGEFKSDADAYSSSAINTICQREAANSGSTFTLDARVLPTTDMSTDNKGDIVFTIAGNNYKLSKKDLLDKIPNDKRTSKYFLGENHDQLMPGVHYIFTFKVSKTAVNISAKVVEWETVTAEQLIPSNARIKLMLEERGDAVTKPVAIYRAEDNPQSIIDSHVGYAWQKGYIGNKNTYMDKGGGIWGLENKWYWPNNMTYYHFRGVMPETETISTTADADPTHKNFDFFALQSGTSYTDKLWGATMRDKADNETADNFKFIYDKDSGFDVKNADVDVAKSQIYQAIGPSEDPIKLILFHMMSEVKFVLTSTGSSDPDHVEIGTGGASQTTLKLKNFNKDGRVLMGNGLVEVTGTKGEETLSSIITSSSNSCTYGVVPQDLTGVQVVITTPDHNEYIVNMKDLLVKSVTDNNIKNPYTADGNGKFKIDRWYPGFKYTYTFILKKKGIDIKVTILDWETVTAGDDNVQIQ